MHNNRKGFSLPELLIVIAVLALLLPLAGMVLYNFLNLNNAVVDRWHIQSAVRLACNDLENNKDGLTNAFQLDLMYDPVIEDGVILDRSTGNITWRNGSGSCNVMNAEGIEFSSEAHKSDVFTYIFSAETWDTEGVYLGELLYMRGYGDNRSHLMLNDYDMGDIPVSVTFSVGTTENMESEDESSPYYTKNTIVVHFSSGMKEIEYGYDTSFAIVNINTESRPINYSGGKLVCDSRWLDDSGLPVVYVAGWDNYGLNYNDAGLTTDNGFPKGKIPQIGEGMTSIYYETNCKNSSDQTVVISETFDLEHEADDGSTETIEAPVIAREANVLRYKSPSAEKTQGEAEDKSTGTNVASCLTGFAMMGSDMKDQVLGNLRMFRDNVLRGTTFGDWFIHEYYYTWSPFLIEHTAFLKPVYKAILIPVSYVCGLIAKI